MKFKRNDEGAVIGLPFQLLVTMLVVAMTASLTYYGFMNLKNGYVDSDTKGQFEIINQNARDAYHSGSGTRLIISISFKSGLEYVKIGGKINEVQFKYKMSGQNEKIYPSDENFPIICTKEGPNGILTLGPGPSSYTLFIKHVIDDKNNDYIDIGKL